jgi:hypothetical protein
VTYAVDGDWSCSRCESFGRIRPGEEPRCECDEVEEGLRERLAAITDARNELAEIAEAATFVIDNGLCERCLDSVSNVSVEEIDRLRKVGT